jgi:hypothetical protein
MSRDERSSYFGRRVIRRAQGACATRGLTFGRVRPVFWGCGGRASNGHACSPVVECPAVPQKDAKGGMR